MVASNTPEPQTFEKDDIKVHLSPQDACKVVLKVELPPKESKDTHKKAIKRINKEVSLPGFRKGKAPESVILKHYQHYVDKEWKDLMVHHALQTGMKLTETIPLNPRRIPPPKIESCEIEKGAVFEFSYEIEPTFEEISLEILKAPKSKAGKVTKKQIQEYMKSLQVMDASWEDIQDRGVKKGDFAILDIESIEQTPPKAICQNKRFEVAKGKIGQWLMDLIMDKKVGDTLEGKSELDEEADEKLAENFQATQCRVHIKGLKKATLPKVDEAFAKKLGVNSVEELNEQIEKRLNREEEMKVEEQVLKELHDQLLKTVSFDLPQSMVDEEYHQRLKERLEQMKQENLSEELAKEKQKEIEASVSEEVNRSLKLWFLSKKIAHQNQLAVSEEEISQSIAAQLAQYGSGLDVTAFIQNENFRSRTYVDLLMRKVNHLLLQQVKKA